MVTFTNPKSINEPPLKEEERAYIEVIESIINPLKPGEEGVSKTQMSSGKEGAD